MWRTILLTAAFAALIACNGKQKKTEETTTVEYVSVEPEQIEDKPGVTLGIQRRTTLAFLDVIERSPNAKSVTKITSNENKKLQIGPPVPSPVAAEIVYRIIESDEQGQVYSNIWKQKVGSAGRTRVTFGKALNLFPAYTRDGKYIIYSSNTNSEKHRLLRIRVGGGGGKTMVTRSSAEDYAPSTSPDNNTIAYTSIPPNAMLPQIWTIELSSGLPTQLREGSWPHVSPDGEKIVYLRQDSQSGRYQIWTLNIDGGEETQLTQNTTYDALGPRWSPDGKWIVFMTNEQRNSERKFHFDLWLMTADGGKKTQLTTNGSEDFFPRWDHEGKSIYFLSNRGGQWNIWRLNPILP
jgi:Tol biopolymer transport system component